MIFSMNLVNKKL